jgi:uncharacterized protein (TIGR02597 family)
MNDAVRSIPLLLVSLVALLPVREIHAQSVATNPVGYVQLTCSANSDTVISVPFNQPASFVGTVASISGSVVTVSGTPGWATNQFVYSGSGTSTYFALLGPATTGSNPQDGMFFTVTANGANTLTLNLNGASLSSVPATSSVSVIPYWTFGTVFPPSTSGTAFIASSSPLALQTQVLVPNYSGIGTNLSTAATYYFYNGAWRLFGDSVTNSHNDDVLIPDGYVTVRNASTATTVTTLGSVLTGNFIVPLATETSGQQDNAVSVCRPINTSLNNLGLITSGAFTPSSSPLALQDQLLLVSNSTVGINKSASATYFYYVGTSGTGWRLFGDALTTDHGNDVIPAGQGFTIRKVATNNGATVLWQNPTTY